MSLKEGPEKIKDYIKYDQQCITVYDGGKVNVVNKDVASQIEKVKKGLVSTNQNKLSI